MIDYIKSKHFYFFYRILDYNLQQNIKYTGYKLTDLKRCV